MIKIKKVLHPTDFSDNSKDALEYALAVCAWEKAELVLLHVCESFEFTPPEYYMDEAEVARQLKTRLNAVKKMLDEIAARHRGAVPETTTVAIGGKPCAEILRYAEERGVDMIVLGTHGRTGLAHFLIGSTAERVVRTSSCPVLTIRAATPEESEE